MCFGDGRRGRIEPDSAHFLADPCGRIDSANLGKGATERLFEILGVVVFLPELVPKALPVKLDAVIRAHAAQTVRQPCVDIEGKGGVLQCADSAGIKGDGVFKERAEKLGVQLDHIRPESPLGWVRM